MSFVSALLLGRTGLRELRRRLALAHDPFLRCFPPGHFYSPIPAMEDIRRRAAHLFDRSVKDIAGVNLNEPGQLRMAGEFAAFYSELPFTAEGPNGCRYHWDNAFFSYGDGVTLYSVMRRFRPQRIIEVGSGFSSALMLDTDEAFFGGRTAFTFIEPHPERLRGLLRAGDNTRCAILEQPIQDVSVQLFDELRENDVLFIDSSHVGKADSDVLHILFKVLPRLRSGVLVHFHDVLWPFEYPQMWFDEGRAWNEAYFLRAFMQYNDAFEVVYFNSFMETHHADLLRRTMPLMLETPSSQITPGNTSFWIRKRA